MNDAAPRYEFRVFSQGLGLVEEKMRRFSQVTEFRESMEIYILSAADDKNNTKIRHDLLDVKSLINRSRGLEQWTPRMKGSFPMRADILSADLFPALGLGAPDLERESYTLRQFLEEVVKTHRDLVAVNVFKRRYSFGIPGCIAEIADVLVNGAAVRTACLEAEDPERVLAVAENIGLDAYENTSYLTALKRIVGMAPLPEEAFYRAL